MRDEVVRLRFKLSLLLSVVMPLLLKTILHLVRFVAFTANLQQDACCKSKKIAKNHAEML